MVGLRSLAQRVLLPLGRVPRGAVPRDREGAEAVTFAALVDWGHARAQSVVAAHDEQRELLLVEVAGAVDVDGREELLDLLLREL